MPNVRKVFFYIGTALFDPLRAESVAYGYNRNLHTFMSNIGWTLTAGKFLGEPDWEHYLNTADGETLREDVRAIRYFKQEGLSFGYGRAGNKVEYDAKYVAKYLGDPVVV